VCTEPFEPLARTLLDAATADARATVTLLVLPHPFLGRSDDDIAALVRANEGSVIGWLENGADGPR
jgi:hypothetical protein